jgi:uncharacterized coiled-coil DUF342 family protein
MDEDINDLDSEKKEIINELQQIKKNLKRISTDQLIPINQTTRKTKKRKHYNAILSDVEKFKIKTNLISNIIKEVDNQMKTINTTCEHLYTSLIIERYDKWVDKMNKYLSNLDTDYSEELKQMKDNKESVESMQKRLHEIQQEYGIETDLMNVNSQ